MNLIEEGSMLEMQKARTPGQKLPTRRECTGLDPQLEGPQIRFTQ